MTMLLNRRLQKVGTGILAIIAVWLVLNQYSSKEVLMAEVKRGLIQDYREFPGQVDIAQKETVCSKYHGIVKQLHVVIGRPVRASEELLRLSLTDYANSLEKADAAYQATQAKIALLRKQLTPAQVKRAELQLMQARATEEQARQSYDQAGAQLRRAQQLSAAGSVTAAQLKEREERVRLADTVLTETMRQSMVADRNLTLVKKAMIPHELLTAETELERLGLEIAQLRQTTGEVGVYAKIDGLILKKYVTAGTTVRAGERLLKLGNYQTAYIRADVPAEQKAKIRLGQKVMISGPELKKNIISGTISACPPWNAEQQSSSATKVSQSEIRVKYDNAKIILKPGSRMKLKIISQEVMDALNVPVAAVFKRFGQPHVYVVEAGKAILRPVQTGIANATVVEIKKGLFAGEQVIVGPGFDLRPGMKVMAGKDL
jgi:HlyD family secretion protein